MNRPWRIWLAFALSAVVVLTVMAWVSAMALRLDRSQAEARAQADLEEKVRLALWRMDSMLAPLIAQESTRPYFTYRAFHPAERGYDRMYLPAAPGEPVVPSPLLVQAVTNILLHFQFDPSGRLTSPQIPGETEFRLARRYTTPDAIEQAERRVHEFEGILRRQSPGAGQSNRELLYAAAPSPALGEFALPGPLLNAPVEQQLQKLKKGAADSPSQSERSAEELQARAQSVKQAFDITAQNMFANSPARSRMEVAEGLFRPMWFGESLVLVRQVLVQGDTYIQGLWLDWPGASQWLLKSVKDLLPNARLEPVVSPGEDPHARLLAALPVRLVPGVFSPSAAPTISPVRFALILAWCCLLFAGTAVAMLLGATLSLSERRADFVSAVTHELRTPLTTFKMYSEMLARGMVREEARCEYLATLCAEASRLTHLVENVLAYARLEKGSARGRAERIALPQLVQRSVPRLAQRAAQAGLVLHEKIEPPASQAVVWADPSAVEQILFNLVDNACKYAAAGAEKPVHLEAFAESRSAILRVRDHGPGLTPDAARRLFQPFSKSATEAAHTAPGVGLGLALSRRLARDLGGDLRLAENSDRGACLELLLPRCD